MPLRDDDEVCFCFHVTLRKVRNFCRVEKPRVASQISECLSAGTGCGWCRPMLRKIHKQECNVEEPWWRKIPDAEAAQVDAEQYAGGRQRYLSETGSRPPPVDRE